jgi:hypothetical protein
MSLAVVCITPGGRLERRAAEEISAALRGVARTERSIGGYLEAPRPPRRIVICPSGRSVRNDVAFLRRVKRRLLWPPAPGDFRNAIGGLRTRLAPVSAAPPSRFPGERGLTAALLLEGVVGPERARAALAAAPPRNWIVASPRPVRLTPSLGRALERAGIRLWALDPVEVLALYASPALDRAVGQWRRLLPPRTPVWIRGAGGLPGR